MKEKDSSPQENPGKQDSSGSLLWITKVRWGFSDSYQERKKERQLFSEAHLKHTLLSRERPQKQGSFSKKQPFHLRERPTQVFSFLSSG